MVTKFDLFLNQTANRLISEQQLFARLIKKGVIVLSTSNYGSGT